MRSLTDEWDYENVGGCMLPYLAVFGICNIICFIGCRFEKKDKAGFYLASVVVVLMLSIFAALRSPVVGTDTTGYALPLYNMATNSSAFSEFYELDWYRSWGWSSVDTIEIGYLVFVWISAKLDSLQLLLFLTSFFTVGPFYLALAKRRKELSLPVAFFVFMLLYFNVTLNAMRQWIAMAFIFLALVGFYDQGKSLRSQPKVIAFVLIACLFHTTAVLAFIPLVLVWYLRGGNVGVRIVIVTAVLLTLILGVNLVREFLLGHGLVRYANYLGNGTLEFSAPQLILGLPFLLVAFQLYSSNRIDKRTAGFYVCVALIGIAFGQLSTLSLYSGRIGQYFDMYFISAAGFLAGSAQKSGVQSRLLDLKIDFRVILCVVVVLYCIAYWFYIYAFMDVGETIPYLFFWS